MGAISGNLGATNFVQGKYGPYVRRRAVTTKSYKERQMVARVRLPMLKNEWLELSEEKRELWRAMAKGVRVLNRLGIAKGMSGHTLYVKTNLWILLAGLTPQDEPPGSLNTPPAWNVTFTVNLPNQYEIDWEGEPGLGGFMHFIFSTRPMVGHEVRPIKHWRFTYRTTLPGTPIDVKSKFIAQWGVPQVGEYVAVKMHLWADGYLRSQGVVAGTIVI